MNRSEYIHYIVTVCKQNQYISVDVKTNVPFYSLISLVQREKIQANQAYYLALYNYVLARQLFLKTLHLSECLHIMSNTAQLTNNDSFFYSYSTIIYKWKTVYSRRYLGTFKATFTLSSNTFLISECISGISR